MVRQQIIFDELGCILESDDALFDTSMIRDGSLLHYFPLIASIMDELNHLQSHDAPIEFNGVEPTFGELQGYYDYSFSKINMYGQQLVQWEIADRTEKYRLRIEGQYLSQIQKMNQETEY